MTTPDLGARAKYRVEIAVEALKQLPPNLRVAPTGALPPELVMEYRDAVLAAQEALLEFTNADAQLKTGIAAIEMKRAGERPYDLGQSIFAQENETDE